MTFIINQIRTTGYPDATVGYLHVPVLTDKKPIHVLEDAHRNEGLKLAGKTCIPDGVYYYEITMSKKFGRETVQLFNSLPDKKIRFGLNDFEGVRVHGGNTTDDTEGCPLVAWDKVADQPKIFNSAEKDLTQFLKANAPKGIWIISSMYNLKTA